MFASMLSIFVLVIYVAIIPITTVIVVAPPSGGVADSSAGIVGDAAASTTDSKEVWHCPQRWYLFGSQCYSIYPEIKTFNEAEILCEYLGQSYGYGRLAEIRNKDEEKFLHDTFYDKIQSTWFGLRWYYNQFQWITGEPFGLYSYNNWRANQPDNHNGQEHCVHLHNYDHTTRKIQWNDAPCSEEKAYICQVEASKTPFDISHYWQSWYPNGACSTTCGKGRQRYERMCNERPFVPCVGELAKYDECDQRTHCPCDWHQYERHCYKAINNVTLSFIDATEYCSSHYDADLLIVRSEGENNFVVNNLNLHQQGYYMGFIATYDVVDEWHWLDQSKPLYKNWHQGEPNNFHRTEYCGTYWNENNVYKWNDFDCSNKLHFICKYSLGNYLDRP